MKSSGTVRPTGMFEKIREAINKLCPECQNHETVSESLNKGLGEVRWLNFPNMVAASMYNLEHFRPCLEIGYSTGHGLALRNAYVAGALAAGRQNESGFDTGSQGVSPDESPSLERAYAINGYADHMLTDMFAGGHIRTPRLEISAACVNNENSDVKATGAGLTAQMMHGEDNDNGVLVTNRRGDEPWRAYGDGNLFNYANAENLKKILEAVELSRYQVHRAYRDGKRGTKRNVKSWLKRTDRVLKLQPFIPDRNDALWRPEFVLDNTCPRYRVDEAGQLQIRVSSDEMARSRIMMLWGAGPGGRKSPEVENEEPQQLADIGDCQYENFIKYEPSVLIGIGGTYGDCRAGQAKTKVMLAAYHENYLFVPQQRAVIGQYPINNLLHTGCGPGVSSRGPGATGELMCQCQSGFEALCKRAGPGLPCRDGNLGGAYPVGCKESCRCKKMRSFF